MPALSPIAEDVRAGLTAKPKHLPARLFYDAEGSALFEVITTLPEYYLTRSELEIFNRHAPQIMARAGSDLTLVELGAGTAQKTRVLIRALLDRQPQVTFFPVDVSATALQVAARSLSGEFPNLTLRLVVGRYRSGLESLRGVAGRKLVLFIGSSVGNYDPPDAIALLRDFAAALSPGDALLLGTDMAKDPDLLIPAYDDAAGVTERFNKNMLARINRELGGHFDLSRFRHVALWNAAASRIEMHLESTRLQKVKIDGLELEIALQAGERIHTENSYKFTDKMVSSIISEAGYDLEESWYDPRRWFGVHLARRR